MNVCPPADAPASAFFARHRITLWRAVVLAGIAALLGGASPWRAQALGAVLVAGGIVAVALATVGRLWCALYVSGRKAAELVTAGPYSLCRHPLYACNLLGVLGLGALSESLAVLAAFALAFAVIYPGVIRSEDRLLAARFPEHAAYRLATPALWPRRQLYRSPARWEVDVPAYLRNVRDSVWFVLGAVVIEMLERAHDAGTLPTLWSLP